MLVRPARFADTHHKLRMIDRVRSLEAAAAAAAAATAAAAVTAAE